MTCPPGHIQASLYSGRTFPLLHQGASLSCNYSQMSDHVMVSLSGAAPVTFQAQFDLQPCAHL